MDQEEPSGSTSKADTQSDRAISESDVGAEEETRVITLDTIIRKGLVEQMPMTAKDINSIVAISMQKEREKQAADRIRLAALNPRHPDYDEEDDSDSSDYDSSNDNELDSSVAPTNPSSDPRVLEITKEPTSVIQKAPKDTRSFLADDLKSTHDDAEDFELKSGDLHYSESNPSDYSESEIRLSSSQSSLKKRLTLSRKRDLSPIAEPSKAKEANEETAKKQRLELSTSCTDSKRNAILLQCSSGFVSGPRLASPKLSLVDNDNVSPKSRSPDMNLDTNESSEHSRDRSIDIASMLQVQHSMDDDTTTENDEINRTDADRKPIVIKLERESPAENMLEIHHVEDYESDIQTRPQTKNGRGGRKSKPNSNQSTYSEQKTLTKSAATKRVKKTKATIANPDQSDAILPTIESTQKIPSTGAQKQRQSQTRDKRQTVRSNPVYAELSESSCDNMDNVSSKAKLQTTTISTLPDPLSIPTTPSTPKMHWKTQLKLQRKGSDPMKSDQSSGNIIVNQKQTKKSAMTPVEDPQPTEIQARPDDAEEEMEDVPVVNKIIEPPHHQKRIPKLKFGSFNFTERRGGISKGPKMVLKYKKKYKKKTKSQIHQAFGGGLLSASDDAAVLDELASTEILSSKIGPKIRKSSKEQSLNEDDTDLKPAQALKTMKSEPPGNIGRSIKERNRVLLEILDQRSCEIRNLKLRLANVMRSNGSNALVPIQHKSIVNERPTFVKPESSSEPGTPDWSSDELTQAFSLQKLNKQLYAHVQQRYTLPLPLPTEIDEFVGKVRIDSSRNLLGNVLNMLRFDGEHMTELERVSVLQISQFPLKHSYSYVEKSDSILHSNSDHMFVILVRGLIGDWQHPIYVNSTEKDLTSVIKSVILKLNDIQFNVIACCSRFEDIKSHSIWTELGVCRGYSYFSHPVTNDPIYTFYYVDDILRSVHHHLMTKNGFHTDTGATINREPVDALLQNNPGAKTLCTELNAPSTFFTAKTIDLLRLLRPDHYASCSDFIEVFAAFQQMMRDTNYGGDHLEQQLQVLSHVQLQLYKLKCRGTNIIPEFKQATTHSIESLKLLQHSMRQKYGVDSFPGRSVSEDFLRSWFVAPMPIEQALQILRCVSFPHKNANTPDEVFDLTTPEPHIVEQIIECIAQKYNLADKAKFINDLRRIEEKFTALWTPFFAGNIHVLRDTLGKVKPSASLEGAVEFVRKRIELRVGQVNALGGLAEWTNYRSSQEKA